MGNFHCIDKIHHSDEFHKKREYINMNGRCINNLLTICINQSTNLKYAINMECLLNYTYSQLSETLFWEYYQKATAFYKIDTANSHKLTYDSPTRKVAKLFDQSLSQSDAEQTSTSLHPTLSTKSARVNNRYYLSFNGP